MAATLSLAAAAASQFHGLDLLCHNCSRERRREKKEKEKKGEVGRFHEHLPEKDKGGKKKKKKERQRKM